MKLPPKENGPKLGSILQPPAEVSAKYTLTAHLWKYLQDYKIKHNAQGNGFGFSLFGPNDVTRTLSARYYKDGSEVLVDQPGQRPRRLTPIECARLMGFETKERKFKISGIRHPGVQAVWQRRRCTGSGIYRCGVEAVYRIRIGEAAHIQSSNRKTTSRYEA